MSHDVPRADDPLPAYEPHLAAFHRAFAAELKRIMDDVPLPAGGRLLDLACGDGFYAAHFAARLAPFGAVVAADLSSAYLAEAERAVAKGGDTAAVRFERADAYALPFPDASFDAAWCAQSLITLSDPVRALAELRRVLKPGGTAAVLENDEFHHVLVNWPVGLEVALPQAVAAAARAEYGSSGKLSPARALSRLLVEAGLEPTAKRTYTADRQAPFDPATSDFLRHHFAQTRKLVADHLPAEHLAAFDRFTDPADGRSIFRQPHAEVTCLNTLFVAVKAEPEPG